MRRTQYFSVVVSVALLLGACGGGSDSRPDSTTPLPEYDFSAVDERFQQFLDESETYEGISVILVDKIQGVVHEKAFGDHTTSIVVLMASVGKTAAASLLLALDDDSAINFDIDAPINVGH